MADRTAVFIDGAYFEYCLRQEFKEPRIDYQKLSEALAGDSNLFRTYYYNCLPYQGNPPTPEESTRYAGKRGFYTALENLPRYEIRLGRLERRGYEPDGRPRFEQKRVDILLGVDLVLLAAKNQIQQAILVAGDSDFIPAVEVAKAEGVLISLHHGDGCHSDLWQLADERTRIDQAFIDSILR